MSFSVNKAILLGNTTKDVELAYTKNGTAIATFTVATNRGVKDKQTEEWTDVPSFHRVKAFAKTAEMISQYPKGTKLYVEGRIEYGDYTNKEGVKVYTTDIIAEKVISMVKTEKSATSTSHRDEPEEEVNIDDIPF